MNQARPQKWQLRYWVVVLFCVTPKIMVASDGIPELSMFEYSLDQINPDFRGKGSATDRNGMVYFGSTAGIVRFDGSRWRQISRESAQSMVENVDGDIYVSDGSRRVIYRFSTDLPMVAEMVYLNDALVAAGLPEIRVGDFRDFSRVGTDVYMTQTWFIARFRKHADGSDDIKVVAKRKALPPHLKFRRVFEVKGRPMVQLELMKDRDETLFAWLNDDGTLEIIDDLKINCHVVSCVELDPNSPEIEFYAAGIRGLFRVRSNQVDEVTPDYVENMDNGRIAKLTRMRNGGAVADLRPRGVIVLDSDCRTWAKLPDTFSSTYRRCTVDSLNRIWVASQNRVARVNTNTSNRCFPLPDRDTAISLSSTDDYLLIASSNDVYYAKTTPDRLRPIGDVKLIPGAGNSGPTMITSVDSDVFIASASGIYYWDSTKPTMDAVKISPLRPTALHQVSENRLLLSFEGFERPLAQLIRSDGKWAVGETLPSGKYTNTGILKDSRGDVWSSQRQYIAGWRILQLKTNGEIRTYPVRGFVFEFEDEIFALTTNQRALHFDRDQDKFVPSPEFQAMLDTDLGEAIINIQHVRNTIKGLRICNDYSALWRVERVDGRLRALRLPQQIGIVETLDNYGRFWSTINGQLTVDSDHSRTAEEKDFAVVFAEVSLSNAGGVEFESANRTIRPGFSRLREPLPLSRNMMTVDETEFDVSSETLNIGLSVPLSEKPEATLLSVRMVGIGDHWSEPSFENQFQFPALPGGSYSFEAKALLPSGEWSQPSRLKITVHPKFYQTLIFKAFATILILGLLTAISFYAVRKERIRVVTLSDVVSKQEETERQLIDSQEELVRRERLQAFGVLAASITHDINNLLTPILSYSSILAEAEDQDIQMTQEFSQTIATCATDAAEIIARLTPIYRPKATSNESCDLGLIVKDVADLLRTTSTGYKRKRIEVLSESESATIWGVPSELREVLINLGNNAFDAIEKEGTVRLRCITQDNDVIVEVQDDGLGMSEDLLTKCTDTFFSSKGEYGTGLGLATSNVIVSSYGGTLTIESSPGTGTTIRLKFPAGCQKPNVRPETKNPSTEESQLNILLIDDIDSTRKAIKRLLSSFGHSVTDFPRAAPALEHLGHESHFHLLITDHQMPEMDGFELCQQVREEHPQTATILMSGYERFGAHECCDLFLRKPVSLSTLREALSEVRDNQIASPIGPP